jgi:micrococcal nuclease
MITNKFVYDVEVVSVYDGDTIRVNIDLGFGVTLKGNDGKGVKLRLWGINTPEVRGKERTEGLKSKEALIRMLKDKKVTLKTIRDKTGKYGRYLAILYIDDVNINEKLVSEGFAEKRMY